MLRLPISIYAELPPSGAERAHAADTILNEVHQTIVPFYRREVGLELDVNLQFIPGVVDGLQVRLLDTDRVFRGFLGMTWPDLQEALVALRSPYWPTTVIHELGHLLGIEEHNIYSVMHPQIERAAQLRHFNRTERRIVRETARDRGAVPANPVVTGTQAILRFLRRWF